MKNLIPREFIQLLLDRIDIVDLIDGRVPLKKKSASNFFACCPFHNEKSASFSVSQNKQFYHCFGCGAHGNAIDFLMQYDRLSFPEAVEALAKQQGMEIPIENKSFVKPEKNNSLYELMTKAAQFYQQQLRQHLPAVDYLKKRGITGEVAKQFMLGYAPAGWDQLLKHLLKEKKWLIDTGMLIKKDDGGAYDRFRERIMFPIHDRRGRIIGFGGRVIDKGEPKYLNSPETPIFQKGHELYGLYHALKAHRELKRAVIVEGYMDVIALFQLGVDYAVATLGTATTANHLQRLFRYTSEIIFCFDGDDAGRTAAWRALLVTLPAMKDGVQIRFLFLPDGEDPDSFIRKEGKAEFEKQILQASSIADFFFQHIAEQTDLTSTDGRARFVKLATEHLNQIPESIFQQMMFDELAKRARVEITALKPPAQPETKAAPKTRSPSALRLVLALLVQQPDLALLINEPLPQLELEGFVLLRRLVELLKQQPQFKTGTLLEYWRDKPEEHILKKLAQVEHMIPETGIQQEFLGGIQQLQKFARKQIIENLLAKASQTGLSVEEKRELTELIQM